MDVLSVRCCGLDLHKKTVLACVLISHPSGQLDKHIRIFATTTAGLLALRAWLASLQLRHVAMESTGISWRPISTVLEDHFQVILANAYPIKALPGRKPDLADCEWSAELLGHGQPGFIAPKPVRQLPDLMGSRKSLVYQRPQQVNRLHKLLATATIQLRSVATDILGKSGRSMLKAILAGQSDPHTVARTRLRSKLPQVQQA